MKEKVKMIITMIVVVLGAGLIAALSVSFTGKDDQPLEEAAEEIIKMVTGDDIDLTPKSPES